MTTRVRLVGRFCIVALAITVVAAMAPAWWRLLTPDPTRPRDFFQDYASARNILQGRPVYTHQAETLHDYLGLETAARGVNIAYNAHPPTSTLLALPLANLDYVTAGWWWNVISLGSLLLALIILGAQLDWRPTLWSMPVLLALLMTWIPLWLHMMQGQLGLLLLLLFAAAWARGRRGDQIGCGLIVGLAATIKIFPILLLGYLALRGRWRGVGAGVGAMAMVTAVTLLITGVEAFITYVAVVLPSLNRWRPDWINASLVGFFARLFAPDTATEPLLYSPFLAAGLTAVAGLGVVGVVVYRARRSEVDFDAEFGLALTATLLLSALTWSHYFVVLLIPLAIWLRRIGTLRPVAYWAWVSLAVTWGLMAIPQADVARALVSGGENGTATPLQALTILALNGYGLLGFFAAQAWWGGHLTATRDSAPPLPAAARVIGGVVRLPPGRPALPSPDSALERHDDLGDRSIVEGRR